ncbi:MAG: hypothetical protein R3242_01110 [Akkermansiaceae bacterium]|nr:hypothetical protein [Akkermansiaceae bacterium]
MKSNPLRTTVIGSYPFPGWLEFAPADRLVFAPDCGLSQTARWAAKDKLKHMVAGVELVKKELGIQ